MPPGHDASEGLGEEALQVSYTLHRKPYTLYPIPYTLHHKRSTLDLKQAVLIQHDLVNTALGEWVEQQV